MNPVSLVLLLGLIVIFYYACLINIGADPAPANAHGHDSHDNHDSHDSQSPTHH